MAYLLGRDASGGISLTKLDRVVLPPNLPGAPHTCPVYILNPSETRPCETVESEGLALSDDELEVIRIEQMRRTRRSVYLPPELIHRVLVLSQEGTTIAVGHTTLKNASLVCKLWTDPARRVLFGQNLRIVNGPASIRRLRQVFDCYPELGCSVTRIDLSSPLCNRTAKVINEVFRRLAGLLRSTPVVKEISIVHVALPETVRNRFFSALHSLNPSKADITSASYVGLGSSGRRPHGEYQAVDDMRALGRLLVEWTSLENLSLVGFCSSPRLLTSDIFPSEEDVPKYKLARLALTDVKLPGRSLFGLVGSTPSSLTSLTLNSVDGVAASVLEELFELLGPTLKRLSISSDAEEEIAETYESTILSPLVNLAYFHLFTDELFSENVLETVLALPNIDSVAVHFPSVSFQTASNAIEHASSTLKALSIEVWDSPELVWEGGQRRAFSKTCESKRVSLLLNGANTEDIENEWWGTDLSQDWKVLEKVSQPRHTSPRTPKRLHDRRSYRS